MGTRNKHFKKQLVSKSSRGVCVCVYMGAMLWGGNISMTGFLQNSIITKEMSFKLIILSHLN